MILEVNPVGRVSPGRVDWPGAALRRLIAPSPTGITRPAKTCARSVVRP